MVSPPEPIQGMRDGVKRAICQQQLSNSQIRANLAKIGDALGKTVDRVDHDKVDDTTRKSGDGVVQDVVGDVLGMTRNGVPQNAY